jgi:hypothetical protein
MRGEPRHAVRSAVLGAGILALCAAASIPHAQAAEGPPAGDGRGGFSVTLSPREINHSSTGGQFRLTGAVHPQESRELIFEDGFESGDTSAWEPGAFFPSHAVVAFVGEACPAGWSSFPHQGRFMVGLPEGGQLGGFVNSEMTGLFPVIHDHELVTTPDIGTAQGHTHVWASIDTGYRWQTYNQNHTEYTIYDWENGIDNSGEGYYPFTTTHSVHTFDTNIDGSHTHTAGINDSTMAADLALPRIQLQLCFKD